MRTVKQKYLAYFIKVEAKLFSKEIVGMCRIRSCVQTFEAVHAFGAAHAFGDAHRGSEPRIGVLRLQASSEEK